MKNKPITLSIIIMLFLSITSCNQSSKDKALDGKDKGNIQTLKLYENLDKKKNTYSLNEFAHDRHLITLETTDNSLFSDIDVQFVTPQYICLKESRVEKLIFFDHSGKYIFKIDAKGNGPGEYLYIDDVIYDSSNSTLFIHDMQRKKMLKYDMNGQFISDLDINDIGSITNLDKEHYAVTFSPFANKNKIVGICNKSFEVEKEFLFSEFNNETHTKNGFIMINSFKQTNHGVCIKPFLSDTVYKIYSDRVEPFVVVDKQKLNPTIEILSHMSQQENRINYISSNGGWIINNLYFMTFYYNKKLYQDIWDIELGELIYRNIASTADDKYGVPVNIDDKLIHVWPVFVNNELVYCEIDPKDLELLKTNAEDNDLMLKFTPLSMNLRIKLQNKSK